MIATSTASSASIGTTIGVSDRIRETGRELSTWTVSSAAGLASPCGSGSGLGLVGTTTATVDGPSGSMTGSGAGLGLGLGGGLCAVAGRWHPDVPREYRHTPVSSSPSGQVWSSRQLQFWSGPQQQRAAQAELASASSTSSGNARMA